MHMVDARTHRRINKLLMFFLRLIRIVPILCCIKERRRMHAIYILGGQDEMSLMFKRKVKKKQLFAYTVCSKLGSPSAKFKTSENKKNMKFYVLEFKLYN